MGKEITSIRVKEAVKESNTLNEVRDSLFALFRHLREEGFQQIGYVSGPITADGPDNINKNLEILEKNTKTIRSKHDFPVFSPTDVFDKALFDRLNANGFKNSDWEVFWVELLTSGEKFVTDIFMTPGWERSHGSTLEFNSAKQVEIEIHYLTATDI